MSDDRIEGPKFGPYLGHWESQPGEPSRYGQDDSRFLRAKYLEPRQQEWVIEEILPVGEMTILVGDGAVGKTTICAAFGALISNPKAKHKFGEAKIMEADAHGTVLWVAAEDSVETMLLPKAMEADADTDNLCFWVQKAGYKNHFLNQNNFTLIDKIKEFENVKAVIFDHIDLAYYGYPETKSGRRQALLDIIHLARSRGFAVLAITHFARSALRTTSVVDRMAGDSFLGKLVRQVLFVEEQLESDPDNADRRFVLFNAKTNINNMLTGYEYRIEGATIKTQRGKIATSVVRWLGRVERQQIIELASRSTRHRLKVKSNRMDDAINFVRTFLAGGPQPVKDLNEAARANGLSERLVTVARDRLNVQSCKKSGEGQYAGWICSLPV